MNLSPNSNRLLRQFVLLVTFLISVQQNIFAQLTIGPATPAQLASHLAGTGVSVFNVTYTGSSQASSTFNAAGTNLGLTNGILLTTGPCQLAIGPNSTGSAGVDMGEPGNIILDSLCGTTTYDATILEFDFIPQNDTLRFRYVFASEEYPEYVCSRFNDVFAFYISGPGISGSQNIALIPNTTQAVAINSVNIGTPGANQTTGWPCTLSYPMYYVDNTNPGLWLEYDGFTTVLTAEAIITPCQTYHLKLMIADAGDGAWDSGVFLEEGSLTTAPVVDAGPDTAYCSGLPVNIGCAPTTGWTYSWTPATGLSNPNISNPILTLAPTSPMTASYVLTASNGTCMINDTMNVSVGPTVTSSFIPPISNICNSDSVSFIYTGNGPSTATFNWNFGGGSVTSGSGPGPVGVTYSGAGTYNVSLVVNNNGCISPPTTAQVNVIASPVGTFNIPSSACIGDTLTLNFTGQTSPTTQYTWNFGNANVISGSGLGPYTMTFTTPGSYDLQIDLDEAGCPHVNEFENIVVGSSVFDAGPDVTICGGTSAPIGNTSTPGTVYSWSPSAGLNNNSVSNPVVSLPNTTGTSFITQYIVTATAGVCVGYDTVNVTVDPPPNYSIAVLPDSICEGGSVQVNFNGAPSGTPSFNWNFGTGNIVSGNGIGPYTIGFNQNGTNTISVVVDNGGCVSTAVNTVYVEKQPTANFTIASGACSGEVVQLIYNGTFDANTQFNWNFGNASVLSGSGNGPYQLMYTGTSSNVVSLNVANDACTDQLSQTINVTQPQFNAGADQTYCSGLSAFIGDQPVPNYTYSWSPAQGLSNQTGSSPIVTISNTSNQPLTTQFICTATINGCQAIDSVNVTVNPNPVASIDALPDTICLGQQVNVNFNGTAVSNASFAWNFGNAIVVSGSGAGPYTLDFPSAGTYPLSLLIDQFGCTASLNDVITGVEKVLAQFALQPHACMNDTIGVVYTGNGGSATFQWNFNGGHVLSGSGTGPYSVRWNGTGTRIVTLETINNFCPNDQRSDTITISQVVADAGTDKIICSGATADIGITGQAGLNYSWTPTIGLSSPTSSTSAVSLTNTTTSAQAQSYLLSVVDQFGCKDDDEVNVSVLPLPEAHFTPPPPQCFEGNNFYFSAWSNYTTGTNYHWYFGPTAAFDSAFAQATNMNFTTPGFKDVTVYATYFGCKGPEELQTIQIYEPPHIDFTPDKYQGCPPLRVNFTPDSHTGNLTYDWTFEGTHETTSAPMWVFNNPGEYDVSLVAKDSLGCTATRLQKKLITVHPVPLAAFENSEPHPYYPGAYFDFTNLSQGASDYLWDFGDGENATFFEGNHFFNDTGIYVVTLYVTSNHGCRDTVDGVLRIEPEFTFFIPNAFSPNGDGRNDFFQGYGKEFDTYQMWIYDRWGKIIYYTSDYNKPWDGRMDMMVQNDTYVYRIVVGDKDGHDHLYLGDVSVVK